MSTSPLSVRRFQVIFMVSWLVLIADHAMVIHWLTLPWKEAIFDSLISNGILFFFCLLILNTLRYYLPRREQLINIFAWFIFFTVLWLFLTKWLLGLSLGYYEGYKDMLYHSVPIRFSIAFLLLGCVTMISVLWQTWAEQKEDQSQKADAEKLAKEAELFKLRQQMQPHFLFNSLNSINALIGTRPAEARKMVQQLSDFLRGTLKKEETQWVILKEELQYLQLYLEIEKVRFGNRLATAVQTNDEVQEMKMPALLLQPIVENAIKFGLYDTTGETVIRIDTSRQDNELVIIVSNPFDPETSGPKQGTGFGLTSIKRRLYLLFGRSDLLTTDTKNNIYTTTVRIPQNLNP
ncbi:MAG: GHKL domain-containing protein [Bacteroidetes bacterium]|jgi:two-component system LytT family sensor kinase|nr:MAG: GHKL domain-containing protein [Bacteroidota bacterium]